MEEKLAEDILLLDLRGISDFTDFFILANGSSDRMLRALAEATEEGIKKETGLNAIIDGVPESGWVILDYGYVMVHILSPEKRDFYDLETLWSKAKVVLRLK